MAHSFTPQIHGTTAQFPGRSFEDACDELKKGVTEGFGTVAINHVQLCPQSPSFVDEVGVDRLVSRFPNTCFRLHANVRVDTSLRFLDASRYGRATHWYYERLAELSGYMNAPAYSLHAGYRDSASLDQMKSNLESIQSIFPCEVLVEGLYPSLHKDWLIKTWDEYRWLMESGLKYAIDLSHLHIVQFHSNEMDLALVSDLLVSPNCREIHLSHNNGRHDAHVFLSKANYEAVWWRPVWLNAMSERAECGIDIPTHFTEGRPPRVKRATQYDGKSRR